MAWTSASNAVFLCLQCAGNHRGLGVHRSFVKSIALDSWSDEEVAVMERGGNQRLRDFIEEYHFKSEFPLAMKFSFLALYYYKAMVDSGDTARGRSERPAGLGQAEPRRRMEVLRIAWFGAGPPPQDVGRSLGDTLTLLLSLAVLLRVSTDSEKFLVN